MIYICQLQSIMYYLGYVMLVGAYEQESRRNG